MKSGQHLKSTSVYTTSNTDTSEFAQSQHRMTVAKPLTRMMSDVGTSKLGRIAVPFLVRNHANYYFVTKSFRNPVRSKTGSLKAMP